MRQFPTVEEMMTPFPHSVGVDQTVQTAKNLMSQYKVRHLPVKDAGRLCGIITERDINFALSFDKKEEQEMMVEDIYLPNPYMVSPTEPLSVVLSTMASKQYGSVLVVDDGTLVGIITTVDVCRTFADIMVLSRSAA